jgi:hypothetical protein
VQSDAKGSCFTARPVNLWRLGAAARPPYRHSGPNRIVVSLRIGHYRSVGESHALAQTQWAPTVSKPPTTFASQSLWGPRPPLRVSMSGSPSESPRRHPVTAA